MSRIEISTRKLIIAFGLLLSLGMILAISNAYCATNMGHLYSPLLYGVTLIALTTGVAIALLLQWKIDKLQLERIINILPEDDRKVIKVILDKKKNITQSELRYLTGLSKVKISRILSKFEQRGIIEKKAYGNTNLIILKKM